MSRDRKIYIAPPTLREGRISYVQDDDALV